MYTRAFLFLAIICALGLLAAPTNAAAPYPYRLVWIWGGLGSSPAEMMQPAHRPQLLRLAEQLRSMKVNGLVIPLGLHKATAEKSTPHLRALSKLLAGYGVGTYVYVHYGLQAETTSSAKPENCPFSKEFAKRWNALAETLFTEAPLVKGYVIKGTGYERIPGPVSCECRICKSKTETQRMLAAFTVLSKSVQKHKGVIFYRTWMTGAVQNVEYSLFSSLSGKLPTNVFLVSKIGYGDFGIREIPHPLFGNVKPRSQHIAELQIFGEYRGRFYNPCEMVTNWARWMDVNKGLVGGMIGDIVVDTTSLDHPLNMVNWYAFGRFASDPDADADEIIRSWSARSFGAKAADVVSDVVRHTSVATSKALYFRGAWVQQHSWLPTLSYMDGRLRGPWVDMKRDETLIGWGRPLDLFPPARAAEYAKDPDLDLFLNRRKITPELLGELSKQQDEAVSEYEAMLTRWRGGKDLIGTLQSARIEKLLEAALDDARIRRLNTQAFINFVLGKDYRPQVDAMQKLAEMNRGTALIREPIADVLKSYRKKRSATPPGR